jgi:hypothetical protein
MVTKINFIKNALIIATKRIISQKTNDVTKAHTNSYTRLNPRITKKFDYVKLHNYG